MRDDFTCVSFVPLGSAAVELSLSFEFRCFASVFH
jgi:hypothetical protein